MPQVQVAYGSETLALSLPAGLQIRGSVPVATGPAPDPLAVVASALDAPVDAPPLAEAARQRGHVAIVVPGPWRPSAASTYLLPILARLARAGLSPARIRVVIARGLEPAALRSEVEQVVGADVMSALRPVQSAPESPDWNAEIGKDEELGPVRVHRMVADAGLVILTSPLAPHPLAGFDGGALSLLPGVAERDSVLAAQRLQLRTLVAPDGSLTPLTGRTEGSPWLEAALRVARSFGRCWLLDVALDAEGRIACAAAGEVGAAHAEAARRRGRLQASEPPVASDLVLVGAGAARSADLEQACGSLLAALPWARPQAPIVWLARAPRGPGGAEFLPWFEHGKPERHLAALRQKFHPSGLLAYAIRRVAREHPVHVVSEVAGDLTRPMGLLPHASARAALEAALQSASPATCAVLSDPLR